LIFQEYSGQTGYGSLPYFVGKQYGTGWLRNIARFAFPFIKKALGVVGNVASNTAEDMLTNENKSFGESVKENVVKEAGRILKRPRSTSINGGKKPRLIIK
jgi:hypothetical protein